MNFCFPFLCPLCRTIGQSQGLCAPCWKTLEFIADPCCVKCGTPFEFSFSTHGWCKTCLKRSSFPLEAHRAVVRYEGAARTLILGLKHGRQHHLIPILAELLNPCARDFCSGIDLIVPVPLHWTRLAHRFFNQSALLAKAFGTRVNLPVSLGTLYRHRYTPSQGSLNALQRHKNVANAFSVSKSARIQGKGILIVDDVYTTGATLNACAEALIKAGALRVKALSVAKVV